MSDNIPFAYLQSSAHSRKWDAVWASLWLLWPMLGLPGVPLESRECRAAPERLLWCLDLFAWVCPWIRGIEWRLIWQRILHYTLQWPHTHTIFIPWWRRRCCVQGRIVKGHIYWFSCVCLTLWRMFGICGPRLYRTSIFFMSYWVLNPSLSS